MAPATLTPPPPTETGNRRRLLAALAASAVLLAGALWWIWGRTTDLAGREAAKERARLAGEFRRDLRKNPIAKPEGRKPLRTAFRAWLAERGISYEQPGAAAAPKPDPAQVAPGVVDFGKMQHEEVPAEPERIEPNEFLDEDDLRHPEIFFEMAKSIPEYSRLEERRDVLDFFQRYQAQLKGDLEKQTREGARPEVTSETRAAIGRYDEAIGKLRKLIEEQEKTEKDAGPGGQ